MMPRIVFTVLLLLAAAAQAAPQPPVPTGLLPAQVARPILDRDPSVAAARAGLEAARHEAGVAEASPHEWTARMTRQRRAVDVPGGADRYGEWNVALERTLRLPAKAAADRRYGGAVQEAAAARYGEALHEAARELMSLWIDWQAAERGRALAADNLDAMERSVAAVEKQLRAGDAARLDVGRARAELADQRRQLAEARTLADTARARLGARFPGADQTGMALPVALPIGQADTFWRERVLAESDELKMAEAALRAAQARAERARADRVPDPTVGVFRASETGGRERLTGVMLSIPLPGGARAARSDLAGATAAMSAQEVALVRRQLEADVAAGLALARGSFEGAERAAEGAAEMKENLRLTERAHQLGEADLAALLLARRQAVAAQASALQAQAAALKAYCLMLVDAHFVWDLEHD